MSKTEAPPRQVDQTRRLYANLISLELDERRLRRPTFKLIQELVKSLIKETRILRDLFRPQDFGPNQDRRVKEQFVQRLIEFAAAQGSPVVNCVAARVVAGLEPHKTHELLQALAKVAHQHRSRRPRTFTRPAEASGPSEEPLEVAGSGAVINQPATPVSGERQQQQQLEQPQVEHASLGQMRLVTSESYDIAKNMQLVRSRLRTLRATMEQLAGAQLRLGELLAHTIGLAQVRTTISDE